MSKLSERNLKFETKQLHIGQETADPVTDARAVPIYATTSYVFHNSQHAADRFALKDAGNIYGRLTNPTEDVFEKRIAALEGGTAALAVASGAAAVSYALQALAKAGDNIVAAKTIYGGTYNWLEHTFSEYGVTTKFVDPDEENAFENAIDENTKAVFIESLGNPNSNIIDIEEVANIAHSHKIPLVIDSTFATPYLLRPFEYGADIVVHSATKFIGGHGTALGGVIVESGKFDWAASGKFPQFSEPNASYHGAVFTEAAPGAALVTYVRAILLRDTGATLSPFHAFLFLQGLETLSLRVERHVENALKVVDFLSKNPKVENVNHPSLPDSKYNALTRNTSRRAQAQSSHLKSRVTLKLQRSSLTTSKYSHFLQMLQMLNLLQFTLHQQLIHSSARQSLQNRALSQTLSDFQSAQRISTILSMTFRKHLIHLMTDFNLLNFERT